jgi:hypothetical protein
MKILIANDNGTMGYMCYESEDQKQFSSHLRRINVLFWAGTKKSHVFYLNQGALINDLNLFIGSSLADYSEIHKAKEFMGLGFLKYISLID